MGCCQRTSGRLGLPGKGISGEEERDACSRNSRDNTATALQCLTAQLLRTQRCIKDLHGERWLLRRQLIRWTGAVQVLRESQEENRCKLQAEIRLLAESNESIRRELQGLHQHAAYSRAQTPATNARTGLKCEAKEPPARAKDVIKFSKLKHGLSIKNKKVLNYMNWDAAAFTPMGEHCSRSQRDRHGTCSTIRTENDHFKAQNRQTLKHMRHLCESIKAASGHKDKQKTGSVHCPGDDGMRPEKCSWTMEDGIESPSALPPMRTEEGHLQELIDKLKDALSLQIKPGQLPGVKLELLHAAGQVCSSYSDFISKFVEATPI
ncbi:uncharacterized protein LOC134944120 [Pseudophryne corroboree]|uniref:uncharacterized protein LOC134944120 n=1 Tax=Pseudophryne corroboree TaxID=495146 RepID=UPI00308145DE